MAKNKDNTPMTEEELEGLIGDMIAGTGFERVSESKILHSGLKIPTPLWVIDCLLGGGIPCGVCVEGYGPPSSGKSSFFYRMMGIFQERHRLGVSSIIDTESSVDPQRMDYLGCDSHRILRLPSPTLDDGFLQLIAMMKKKLANEKAKDLPLMVLWDTIAKAPVKAEFEAEAANAGGMMLKARQLKFYLSILFPHLEKQPVMVIFLNQVTTSQGTFASTLDSGGGWGLKHDIHFKLYFYKTSEIERDSHGFVVRMNSEVTIEKSKLGPIMDKIPMSIDITKGGIIDEARSFCSFLYSKNLLATKSGGWYMIDLNNISDERIKPALSSDHYNKYRRWEEFIQLVETDVRIRNALKIQLCELFSSVYEYQSEIIAPYKERLIQEILDSVKDVDTETGEIKENSNNG